ncbi:hypothetical protein PIB30_104342, partial [Stylosanthes scabra]|nr:hypothetical protein [Stylosanthes scabra]
GIARSHGPDARSHALFGGPLCFSFGPRAVTQAEVHGRTPVNSIWAESNSSHHELARGYHAGARYVRRHEQRREAARWSQRASRMGFRDRAVVRRVVRAHTLNRGFHI